ncbi:MAG: hypothetical protein NTU80_07440 [Verrucomicrobia bacterium]|nr:hypothetical protein [Verrucomicrobiota bacterium]
MRTKLTSAIQFTAALVTGFGFISFSSAQTVATHPVGAVSKTLPTGYSMVGLTLLNSSLYSGAVTLNDSSSVTLSGSNNFGLILSGTGMYYLEVVSGPLEGERFDVNTSATIASANSVVTINPASQNNTVTLTSNALASCNVVLRSHITLNSLSSWITPALTGNNSSSSADQILIFNKALNAFDTYFLRADNVTWRKIGVADSVGASTVIPPGVGIFIRKVSTSATLTQVGAIRVNDFAMPLKAGLSLLAPGYPIPNSPTSLGANLVNGWFGSNSSGAADQIITFNPSGNSYITYFLRSDGATWRQVGLVDDFKSVNVIGHDSAFWLRKATADLNYILVRPFTL